MKRILTNSLITLSTLALLFFLGEGTIRLLQVSGKLPNYSKPLPISGQQAQINANLVPLRKVTDKRLFVEFDPKHPSINTFGFRGPEPSLAKTPGTFRIAIIGDSVAFGFGLTREESFPYLLEKHLRQQGTATEVLNFSVSGYGLEAYEALYDTKVRQFQPDLVIVTCILNDPMPTEAMFHAIGGIMQQEAKIRRIAKTSQLAAWLTFQWQHVSGKLITAFQHQSIYTSTETRQLIQGHLQHLKTQSSDAKQPLVAFIFPYFTNFADYEMQDAHAVYHSILTDLGIPFHDLLTEYSAYNAQELRLSPTDTTHPNAQGHIIAAAVIAEQIKMMALIPDGFSQSNTPAN
ncbi:MAG: SGNH/GDSL hydrolase family protein [Gammaproteobacteria bacterium]|nr:MAG: SGNH/GDSL hydrolase family protein [Gammaproteobacteria bacterium]